MSAPLQVSVSPAGEAPVGILLLGVQLTLVLFGFLMQLLPVLPFAWCRELPTWWRGVGYLVSWGGSLVAYALFT